MDPAPKYSNTEGRTQGFPHVPSRMWMYLSQHPHSKPCERADKCSQEGEGLELTDHQIRLLLQSLQGWITMTACHYSWDHKTSQLLLFSPCPNAAHIPWGIGPDASSHPRALVQDTPACPLLPTQRQEAAAGIQKHPTTKAALAQMKPHHPSVSLVLSPLQNEMFKSLFFCKI